MSSLENLLFYSNPPTSTQSRPVSLCQVVIRLERFLDGGHLGYPGTDRGNGFPEADFAEELEMGYRYYDAVSNAPAPLFSFGFGLSYANFTLGPLTIEGNGEVSPTNSTRVHAYITHDSGPAGATVAQLYARYPSQCKELLRLITFEKIFLIPGEDADIVFEVSAADIKVFDVISDTFMLCSGTYTLLLGASASDFRASNIVVTE